MGLYYPSMIMCTDRAKDPHTCLTLKMRSGKEPLMKIKSPGSSILKQVGLLHLMLSAADFSTKSIYLVLEIKTINVGIKAENCNMSKPGLDQKVLFHWWDASYKGGAALPLVEKKEIVRLGISFAHF